MTKSPYSVKPINKDKIVLLGKTKEEIKTTAIDKIVVTEKPKEEKKVVESKPVSKQQTTNSKISDTQKKRWAKKKSEPIVIGSEQAPKKQEWSRGQKAAFGAGMMVTFAGLFYVMYRVIKQLQKDKEVKKLKDNPDYDDELLEDDEDETEEKSN